MLFFIILLASMVIVKPFFHDNLTGLRLYRDAILRCHGDDAAADCMLSHPTNPRLFFWNPYNSLPPPTYAVHVLFRFFTSLSMAQVLRIISFLLTGLPAPNYHCHPFSPFYLPPTTLYECVFRLNLFYSCGDLIFSSHLIFVVTSGLVIIHYCRSAPLTIFIAVYIVVFCILVICAHKHYTVDMIICLYVLPLIWYLNRKFFPDKYPLTLVTSDIPLPVIFNGVYATYLVDAANTV
uniref:Sphingomyelin synthase-related 1 n=1 Tax=Lygus hesperus TaxID=30085 RepID=A0A0A9YDK9_LYGHE